MTREELIARAKARLAEAYEEVAYDVVVWLEKHPSESLQTLCKEIDPDNWNALRQRAQRLQKSRSEGESERSAIPEWKQRDTREARRLLRDQDTALALVRDPQVFQTITNAYNQINLENQYRELELQRTVLESETHQSGGMSYGEAREQLEHDPAYKAEQAAERYRPTGALALFLEGCSKLNTGLILMKEHGIKLYDLKVYPGDIDELIQDALHLAGTVAPQYREAFEDAKTRLTVEQIAADMTVGGDDT